MKFLRTLKISLLEKVIANLKSIEATTKRWSDSYSKSSFYQGLIFRLKVLAMGPEHEPLKQPPEVKRVLRPLIMARLELDGESDETTPQFLSHGWSKGHHNRLTQTAYQMAFDLTNGPNRNWVVKNARITFDSGLAVKAVEFVDVEGFEFYGDKHLAMFFPPSRDNIEQGNTNMTVGGPSGYLLQLIQELALKIECKIASIDVASDDSALVIFKAWSGEFSLYTVAEHYNTSLADEA